uniref:Hsp90 co-chaperone Cdc37 n=1 Tax=Zonotrichia albicollis TaxID=44394 RepID=A0A8D2M2I8_ZONAL
PTQKPPEARVERMEQFQKEKEELDKGCRECKRKLAECLKKMKELELAEPESGRGEMEKLQAEAQQLRNEEKSWESKLEELRKKEKNMPWNVDTLSKDGFSKSVFNVKPEEKEETEEQKEKKHKTFVERYEKQIKHFGMLRRWDDSQKYLSDNPHLVCEETANYLVIWCIDLEVEEKHALMEQVAHQTIVMQFILELAKSLKVDPRACFRQFFTKIKCSIFTSFSIPPSWCCWRRPPRTCEFFGGWGEFGEPSQHPPPVTTPCPPRDELPEGEEEEEEDLELSKAGMTGSGVGISSWGGVSMWGVLRGKFWGTPDWGLYRDPVG